jgi:hypothetical protein
MQKPTEESTVSTVNFLAEQDGPAERELKQALAKVFVKLGSVTTAYLALVDYGRPFEKHVALCIVTDEEDLGEIVATASTVFQSIFNSETHLDIVPLSKEAQSRISLVCHPSFTRKAQ